MATKAKPIPDGYEGVIPYICVKGASEALAFYAKAFGAKETLRIPEKDGRVAHAEFKIGNALVMIADEHPEIQFKSPATLGGTTLVLHVYVTDVDAIIRSAVAAGAKLVEPIETQFYGDRAGKVSDPFGYTWIIATHVEDVPPEEAARRAKELYG